MPDFDPHLFERDPKQLAEEIAERERQKKQKGPAARANHDPEVKAKGNGAADPDARKELLRELRIDIGQLNSESTAEHVAAVVGRIAACAPDEITRESLYKTIKAQTNTPIGAMRKQIADAEKQQKQRSRAQTATALLTDREGRPLALEANAIAVIRAHPEMVGLFGLDEFHQLSTLMRRPPWGRPSESFPRPTCDADVGELLSWLQRHGIHLRGRGAIRTVLAPIVGDVTFHPVRDYLDSLVWDGEPRLDKWLTYYLGVAPIENYTAKVGRCWMISAVARIYRPGCIAKYVLIIEGDQDLGKSSALRILGGDWFTDDIASLGSKDSQMQVGNAWIIELAELDSTRRAAVNAIKAFISRPVDQFRPPYGDHVIRQKRQSVLAGTVNPAGRYLHDETGAVRFWPVAATNIDLAALQADRDQLWAEAVARYKNGEHWWPDGDFAPQEEQEKRTDTASSDPWFDPISDWLRRYTQKAFTACEILAGALEIPKERMDKDAERRLGSILRRLGYLSGTVRVDGTPCRRWRKKGDDDTAL